MIISVNPIDIPSLEMLSSEKRIVWKTGGILPIVSLISNKVLIFAAPKMMLMAEGGDCKCGEKQLERRLRPFAEWVAVLFPAWGKPLDFMIFTRK